MQRKNSTSGLTLSYLWADLAGYNFSKLRHDLFAAGTVALVALPQAMALALILDLPPSVGVFSAIIGIFLGALFGSSKHVVGGPTNTTALLLQGGTAQILLTYYPDVTGPERDLLSIQIVLQMVFVVGAMQIIASAFNLGRLIQFVSRSVIVGYVTGVAVILLVNQLFYLLAIPEPVQPIALYETVGYLVTHLSLTHTSTLILGVGCLLIYLLIEIWDDRLPGAALMVVAASVAVYFFSRSEAGGFHLTDSVALVEDFGELGKLQWRFSIPWFDLRILNALLPTAFAISLLSVVEATTISRNIAVRSNQDVQPNQDIFGLGIANIGCALFGGMYSSGSFSRSSVNYHAGARTRFAAVYAAFIVALLAWAVSDVMGHIPLVALAMIILVTSVRMVDRKMVRFCLRATRSDALVLLITAFSCIIFSLDIAFYIGVVLSIAFYLRKAATPTLLEYSYTQEGENKLMVISSEAERKNEEICIIHVDGELFFGAADMLQSTLRTVAEDPKVRVIILHLKNAHHMDATACLTLKQIHESLRKGGRYLLASGVTTQVWRVLQDSTLAKALGDENIFLADRLGIFSSTRKAWERAEELVAEWEKEQTPTEEGPT